MDYSDEHKYEDIINMPHHVSASRPRMYNGVADEVVSVTWKRAKNTREAFIDEYLKQRHRGVLSSNINANTYNRIWSPGRRYYYQDYGRY